MKVTLSYFIEPNPGRFGSISPDYYRSAGLRFDFERVGELLDDFRARVNADERGENWSASAKPDPHWLLGPKSISGGSLHCDVREGPAIDLLIEQVGRCIVEHRLGHERGVLGFQRAQHGRQHFYAHELRDADAHRTGGGTHRCRGGAQEHLRGVRHGARLNAQLARLRGRREAVGRAREQRGAERALERLDPGVHRGLRSV